MRMAEEQAAHRRTLESRHMTASIWRMYLGLAAGLMVALAGFGVSYELILAGQTIGGSVFAGGTLVALVGTFVYGSNQVKGERLRKQRMLLGRPE